MYELLDALYSHAVENGSPNRWILDPDLLSEYRACGCNAESLQQTLMERLDHSERVLLQRLLDNLSDRYQVEHEAMFVQGLANGLRLGMLTHLV